MKIYAVGVGPGALNQLTAQAREVLEHCTTICGYKMYLEQFPELFAGKKLIAGAMMQEMERCQAALNAALEGETVAVISSGDAGVYGMAGLLLELTELARYQGIEVEVIAGITAANAAAALVGAPLMNDYMVLSLSDLLTPREVILKRLDAAVAGDLVTVLYNPGSTRRRELLEIAIAKFDQNLPAAVVHQVSRPQQSRSFCLLREFPFAEVDMTTVVIIGNSRTVIRNDRMYTVRGYQDKYGRPE